MHPIQALINKINHSLSQLSFDFTSHPKAQSYALEIKEAMIYPFTSGGKRIRPLLTLLAAGAFGGERALLTAHPSAVAIEMIHTYTLVHDDLPCMDNDDLRRGKPTTHKVFSEAKALLVGDGLLTQSFLLLAQTDWQQKSNFTNYLIKTLAHAAGPSGVIWGQWLDLSLTGKEDTDWDIMEIVHTYKTGVLLAASLEMGFICGISQGNTEVDISLINACQEKMKQAGIYIGLAFQIIDDILDATKTTKELGKTAGKDEVQNKFTAFRLLGKERAQDLSTHYTTLAINLLKEVFLVREEKNSTLKSNAQNSDEISHYQNLLIKQIQDLLIRPN